MSRELLSFLSQVFKLKDHKLDISGLKYGIHKYNLTVLESVETIDLYLLRL